MTTLADIDQVDIVLAEAGDTVLFIGHLRDTDDAALFASVPLPLPIDEAAFVDHEWRTCIPSLEWRLC